MQVIPTIVLISCEWGCLILSRSGNGIGAAAGRKGRSPAVVHVEGSQNTGGVLTLVDGARRSTRILAGGGPLVDAREHRPRRDEDAKDKAERRAPSTN